MPRLLVVSRSMALAMRIADDHDVVEYPVENLEELAPAPDVDAVVLDLGEPAAAMQTLDRLRSRGHDTRVLIVSGYQPAWRDLVTLTLDRVVVVPLPITRAALLDGIDQLLGDGPASIRPPPALPGARPGLPAASPGLPRARLPGSDPPLHPRVPRGCRGRRRARSRPPRCRPTPRGASRHPPRRTHPRRWADPDPPRTDPARGPAGRPEEPAREPVTEARRLRGPPPARPGALPVRWRQGLLRGPRGVSPRRRAGRRPARRPRGHPGPGHAARRDAGGRRTGRARSLPPRRRAVRTGAVGEHDAHPHPGWRRRQATGGRPRPGSRAGGGSGDASVTAGTARGAGRGPGPPGSALAAPSRLDPAPTPPARRNRAQRARPPPRARAPGSRLRWRAPPPRHRHLRSRRRPALPRPRPAPNRPSPTAISGRTPRGHRAAARAGSAGRDGGTSTAIPASPRPRGSRRPALGADRHRGAGVGPRPARPPLGTVRSE